MEFKGLAKLFDLKATEESAAQEGAHKCAAGHVLDPTWGDFCPFCDAEKRGQEKSPPLVAAVPPVQAMSENHGSRRTRVGDSAPVSGRMTKVDDGTSPTAQPPDTRRICGVLMTYTWSPSGDMFPVREGKNRIGAGAVSDEGHRDCEVLVRADPTMSAEHALILCRHGRYELVDLNSSNGTFLNDEMVSTQAMQIEMGAKIKAGNTVFEFLKFQVDPSAPGIAAQPAPRQDPSPSPRDTGTGVR